jgi:methylmalonyl-CoA mutase
MSQPTASTHLPAAPRRLFAEFAPHSYADWKAAAEELLKGKSFDKLLITPTCEGFPLQPIYNAADIAGLPHLDELPGIGRMVRGSAPDGYIQVPWRVSQELTGASPAALNAALLEGLANGQNEACIWLDTPSRTAAPVGDTARAAMHGRCGMPLETAADMTAALADVRIDCIPVWWRAGMASPAVAALYLAEIERRGLDLAATEAIFDFDPLANAVATGGLELPLDQAWSDMAALLHFAQSRAPLWQPVCAEGMVYHNGGASSSQEMGAVLATAVEYLRQMQARGVATATTQRHMRLSLAIGPNYFIEIAKLRAMRLLWNRILDALDVPATDRRLHLHARTGLWNKTVYDPHVNMLRTTTEAFAAVVGGCDSLHVGCFDEVVRETDSFSQRIARNTHAILGEECNLMQVIDPAGGSYAIEKLTDQMAASAWQFFQQIEAAGGMAAALASGLVQQAVAAVRAEKAKAIQQRRDILVGINQYPLAGEQPLPQRDIDFAALAEAHRAAVNEYLMTGDPLAVSAALTAAANCVATDSLQALAAAATAGATRGQLLQALHGTSAASPLPAITPIRLRRAAEDYEELRRQAAAITTANGGTPPSVLQLNIGPSRKYRLRADWTSAFFQVGGFHVDNERDFADAAAAVAAASASPAHVAVITADDETYAASAASIASAVRAARPDIVLLLAGAPGDNEAALRAAGIHDFVNVRVNAYTFNRDLLAQAATR